MQPSHILPLSIISAFPGLEIKGLITLASSAGMGNSSFTLYLVKEALSRKLRVGFVTFQESNKAIEQRLRGMVEADVMQYVTILDNIAYLKSNTVGLTELFKKDLDLIILDDLDSALGRLERGEDERNELIKQLHALSNENEVALWLNVQLGQQVQQRGGDCVPMFRDVNWCRMLSFYSGQIYSLYRPGYFGFTEDDLGNDLRNRVELVCLKNEFGEVGRYVMEQSWNRVNMFMDN